MLNNQLPARSNVGGSPIRQDHRRRNTAPHGSKASHPYGWVLTPTARCCSGTGRVTYSPDFPAITGSTCNRIGPGSRSLTAPKQAGNSSPLPDNRQLPPGAFLFVAGLCMEANYATA